MDTKTQNIVITVLGLMLVACLWFTFNIFGKSDDVEDTEIATLEESTRDIDLDFDDVDVDVEALREKFGDNIDSVYAAEFPDDEEVDFSKLSEDKQSYAPQRTNYDDANVPAYMVIAGAFSTDANAETFRKMLAAKGYSNAEVVKFQSSKYTSVCVNRTDDLSAARSAVESLKGMNVEAYVHTRKTSKR